MLDKPVQIVKVTASTLSFRDIEIHPAYRQVFKAGNEIHLNYGEKVLDGYLQEISSMRQLGTQSNTSVLTQ